MEQKQILIQGVSGPERNSVGSSQPDQKHESFQSIHDFSANLYRAAQVIAGALKARFIYNTRVRLGSAIRAWPLYTTDLLLAAIAFVASSYLRYGHGLLFGDPERLSVLLLAVPSFVGICALVFPVSGLYRRNWNYASVAELFVVVKAVVFSSVVFVSLMFLFTRLQLIPRSVVAIEIFVLTSLLLASRIHSRIGELPMIKSGFVKLVGTKRGETVPILLVGVCASVDQYLRALQRDALSNYDPVGILDDAPEHQGLVLRSVPVLGKLADFESIVASLELQCRRPRHVIFSETLTRFGESTVQQLIERAERHGIAVSRLSSATELRNARSESRFQLKTIELTDLLERPQKALDRAALGRLIYGRRVLVTGAGGSIGSELTRQVAALLPSELILIENSEFNLYSIDLELREGFEQVPRKTYMCDVRDAVRINEIFDRHRPELVFHAAALKHVPMVELNPCEGVMTNVIGTMNVAEASRRTGVSAMVQISTDKAVNTTNVMGATKRLAELYCQALDIDGKQTPDAPRFMTVRFGNVLGSSGSLIPLFKRQLARGGPLTVTDPEMTRYFMTIREAVELTMQASAYGLQQGVGQGEIFVLDMGEPIKIIDIARRMIRLAGCTPDEDIKIQITGRRPGEKLFEELFDHAEKRVPSPVPSILGAIPTPIEIELLRKTFSEIRELAIAGDEDGMFKAITTLLPNYSRERNNQALAQKAVMTLATAGNDNAHRKVSA